MPSFLQDKLKRHCSGCGACVQVCGVNAIRFKEDGEGFIYPEIDKDKCVNCGRCVSACPFEKGTQPAAEQKFYAAKSKEKNIIKDSSSGGAFYEIAKAFCDEGYAVFGAEMSPELKVRHVCVDDFSQIKKLQKSKYVQSDTGDTFKEAKQLLNEGKKVLFSGTPCQISGFRNFLGRDYDNLVTLDIVCHGVPSQKLFDEYISELSDELGERIVSFTFRNKKNFDKSYCNQKTVLIKTESGREIVKAVLQCEYLAAFHDAMFYRPSCAECPFANTDRPGDITLADFWGAEKFHREFDDGKGVSLVIVNSEKGRKLFEKADLEYIESDKEKAISQNAQLRRPVKPHENRDKFFKLNPEKGFCKSVKECMDFPSEARYKLYMLKTSLKNLLK